jgi:hypothetical protein
VRLILAHPEVSDRSCADCRKWVYEDTAERLSSRKSLLPSGEPMRRVVPDSMPCHLCPKIPRGSVPRGETPGPQHAVELSLKNAQAYWHYRECRAVGEFPRGPDGRIDPIVRRNAALIAGVEQAVERDRIESLIVLLSLKR